MATYPRIPINPRLAFGESIEKICPRGRLHPGLKELFTKAYFSAHQNECLVNDNSTSSQDYSSPGAWIITILKFAQGDVAVRLSLKRRLETGRWIMPLQVPPAAPLWLIRHFLGRLQTPLMLCHASEIGESIAGINKWIELSKVCRAAMYHFNLKSHHLIQEKIAQTLDQMQLEACLILISLITLIRNLSYEPIHSRIDKHAVTALIEYFLPALISRPYRPGYLTKEDKGCCPALCYLSHNLREIQALCKRPETQNKVHLIFDSPSGGSILDLHKYNKITSSMKKAVPENLKFEHLKQDIPDSKTTGRHAFTEPTTMSTPKRPNEVCQSDELKTKRAAVASPISLERTNRKEEWVDSNELRNQLQRNSMINCIAPINTITKKVDKETLTDFGQECNGKESIAAVVPTFILSSERKGSQPEFEKECLQGEGQVLPRQTSLKTVHSGNELKRQSTEINTCNFEETQDLVILNPIESTSTEHPCAALPCEFEEHEKNPLVDVIEYSAGRKTNFDAEGTPEKKCQALKLAYKLRGQWLAWRLAGLFLDGATSQISGNGYAKLSHDAPF